MSKGIKVTSSSSSVESWQERDRLDASSFEFWAVQWERYIVAQHAAVKGGGNLTVKDWAAGEERAIAEAIAAGVAVKPRKASSIAVTMSHMAWWSEHAFDVVFETMAELLAYKAERSTKKPERKRLVPVSQAERIMSLPEIAGLPESVRRKIAAALEA